MLINRSNSTYDRLGHLGTFQATFNHLKCTFFIRNYIVITKIIVPIQSFVTHDSEHIYVYIYYTYTYYTNMTR